MISNHATRQPIPGEAKRLLTTRWAEAYPHAVLTFFREHRDTYALAALW